MKRFLKTIVDQVYVWIIPPYKTCIVEDYLPQKIDKRILYIVQEDGFVEQAAMLCPCGCKRILHMNLIPDERPCWNVTHQKNEVSTLHPSVWRKKDCESHFWFRKGRIIWCPGSGPWWYRFLNY